MALPITVPYTFGNATTAIPLSNLDSDYATVYQAVNGIGNGSVALANVTITGGTVSNVSGVVPTPFTANGVVYASSTSALTTGSALVFDGTNLGVGVTPSAWGSGYKALQVFGGSVMANTTYLQVGVNNYFNGTNDIYINTGYAVQYQQNLGKHIWLTAPSGTAGNAITFTQAMTLDASGNLGVGTTSPISDAGRKTLSIFNSDASVGGQIVVGYNSSSQAVQILGDSTGAYFGSKSNIPVIFRINQTESARIDTSGNLLVGTTSVIGSGKVSISFPGATVNAIETQDSGTNSGAAFLSCRNSGGTQIGSISRVGTTNAVVFNTTSDQRLKSNIENATPILDTLMQVQVRQFDWTESETHQDYGFIAQEVEPLLSGVVTKGKTEEDIWQLDYSRLTPHLLKAIQEQQALIQSLKARLDAANL